VGIATFAQRLGCSCPKTHFWHPCSPLFSFIFLVFSCFSLLLCFETYLADAAYQVICGRFFFCDGDYF